MEKYIGESLAAGIICPSSSPTGAGFFFVGKKDGSKVHLCVFYSHRLSPAKQNYDIGKKETSSGQARTREVVTMAGGGSGTISSVN